MSSDPRGPLPDPRAAITDPRIPITEPRVPLTVCTCGLPNCSRVGPHPGAPHPPGFSPEGHYPHGVALPIGAAPVGHIDPTVLYSMQGAYGLKENNPEMLRSLPQLNGYYPSPYDPTSVYPYMNGYAGIDARRKNATKESTNTLKAWLFEHRKNPYPTKGEKIMLAILTKMTLTQVSTWFANARRRLKKENKMTWTSKDDMDLDDDVSEHNSDINVSGSSGGGAEDGRHHKVNGSIGDDDDDVLSITSAGEIDVEDHSDIGETEHRIPPLLPHTVGPAGMGAPHPMFMAHRGAAHMFSPLMPSLEKSATSQPAHKDGECGERPGSPSCSQSERSGSPIHNHTPLSPVSSCPSKSSHVAPITPPPSPKDYQAKQSPHMTSPHHHHHHSSATIHHHPAATTSPHTSNTSTSPASSSTSSKPKIWSIADVVNKKDSSSDTKSTSSLPSPSVGGASSLVTIPGGPSRLEHHGGLQHPHSVPGVVVPGSDGSYSLAYYPYGLPNPAAAAAIMASRVHPYARLGAVLPHGHPAQAMHPSLAGLTVAQSRPEYHSSAHPSAASRTAHQISVASAMSKLPSASVESRRPSESSSKPGVPRVIPTTCTPTAFTPVAQRQV